MAELTPPAVQVCMKDAQRLMITISPQVTICVRGRHAVGKSEAVYQAACQMRSDFYKDAEKAQMYEWSYEKGLPVIERRLSQLTEGDMTGMPSLDSDRKSTAFKPVDWYIDACERPVVLFLDERNRALDGVKQAVFQIQDSRTFYGYKLHPETRVVIAENVGDHYNVQQCDPAETSRPAIVELCPTVEEWLEYAGPRCHEITVAFIRANPEFLEMDPNATSKDKVKRVYDPNAKYPDRRAWFKADYELTRAGLYDDPTQGFFYVMAASMIGQPAAIKLADFARNMDMTVTLEELLSDWPKARKKMGAKPPQAKFIELAKKLETFFKGNKNLTDPQAKNVGEFMKNAPGEARMVAWAALQNSTFNLFMVHKYTEELMLQTATGEDTEAPATAPKGPAQVSPPKQRK